MIYYWYNSPFEMLLTVAHILVSWGILLIYRLVRK
ncbi:hypothetical protein FDG92_gp54 [Arthrobacter phage Jasmine]|uniref:Uncharacterized protein n=1 Tax=Arthrobacter phage Jasmine TaxID=1772302 RepID=A0A0U4JLT6_9CAUD|nr:hypothetical protein FDG92_gp54 [Arthrobacter phage Jasmine]ALY09329.1 hypothetical protein JASMINE_55 [Arthrobacter phage Jasmine]